MVLLPMALKMDSNNYIAFFITLHLIIYKKNITFFMCGNVYADLQNKICKFIFTIFI